MSSLSIPPAQSFATPCLLLASILLHTPNFLASFKRLSQALGDTRPTFGYEAKSFGLLHALIIIISASVALAAFETRYPEKSSYNHQSAEHSLDDTPLFAHE